MEPEFYANGPAIVIARHSRVLSIADPHFGVEADLHRHGIHFESRSELRLNRLMEIIDESDPDYLVVLGDLKHMISYLTYQEKTEMPKVLKTIRRETEFRLAPGNHDTGLEHFLESDELLPPSGAVIDGTGYFHGHMIPDSSLFGHLIVTGHHHPIVNLYDDVGCALRGTPGYLLAEVDTSVWENTVEKASSEKISKRTSETTSKTTSEKNPTRVLLVPAFYELAGGMDVRLIPGNKISPIAKAIIPETGEVFLRDGTYVAPFTELRPDPLEVKRR